MEENSLINFINEKTCNKFYFLKLKQVFFDRTKNLCRVVLIYPSDKNLTQDEKIQIMSVVKEFLQLDGANFDIKINKSFIESDLVEKELFSFLEKNNPLIYNGLDKSTLVIDVDKNLNIVTIKFSLEEKLFKQYEDFSIEKNILRYLDKGFCCEFKIQVKKVEEKHTEAGYLESRLENLKSQNDLDFLLKQSKDKYLVTDKKIIVGKEIISNPRHISSVDREVLNCVVAGRINFLTERTFTSKRMKTNKDCIQEAIIKPYFNFQIKDNTSSISAVIFPSKANYHKMHLLKNGDMIVANGDIRKYNDRFEIMIKDISLCRIPSKSDLTHSVTEAELNDYRFVKPLKYSSFKQSNLFDSTQSYSREIQTQTYVVYDFETTGIDPARDEIIEIGALKIVNGVFTEVFSTLVKPKRPIPPEASRVNRITDDMVANSFSIEQVICDFYIFCKGCQMVGYNSIAFDSLFLNNAAKKVGIKFDNGQLDAFLMAKSKLKGLRNYKLGTVANHLEVNLIDAHRALNDVLATAEVFMKLY